MSNIGFNCDVCGRQVQGCTFVNGMKFCAKCYQETFGNTTKNLNNIYEGYLKILNEKDQRIDELEKQLAEKDADLSLARNEIDTLKHNLNISQEHDNVMCEQYFEKCKQHNQYKIDFAIEQLEKVKDFCDGMKWAMVHLTKENTQTIQTVLDEIDNQIKELRGENV